MFPTSRLEKFGIRFPFLIAPMVGVSHVAFRELVRWYTPPGLLPLIFSEMLSTRRLPSQDIYSDEMLFTAPGERALIPQLLGNEEQFIGPSIERMMRVGPWGFDINMGCPQKQTLSHNWGVLLMGDQKYAAEVVRMAKRHSPVPVSVKLRAGFGDEPDVDYLKNFTGALEDAGADWITVHCRPRGQKHSGDARWDVVDEIAKVRKIPVVGNGDVQTAADAVRCLQEYGVDGVMIARAAIARPWILWQIADALGIEGTPAWRAGDKPPATPQEEGREYFRSVLRLTCLLEQYFGDQEPSLKRLSFHVGMSQRWLPFGHVFTTLVRRARSLVEARDVINDYAEKHPQPLAGRIRL